MGEGGHQHGEVEGGPQLRGSAHSGEVEAGSTAAWVRGSAHSGEVERGSQWCG
jgi:hypothetical protein